MATKRRKCTNKFKTMVALAAIREQKTLSELSKEFEVSPNQISQWKQEAIRNMEKAFGGEGDEMTKFINSLFANPSNPSNCFTLLHFSDIHGGGDNLARIVKFKQKWQNYIDDAICTGDIVNFDITDGSIFDEGNQNYVEDSNEILLTIGNHDTKVSGGVSVDYWYQMADTQEAYNLVMGNKSNWGAIVQPNGAGKNNYYPCYYYKDYANAGVRLIVLDLMSLGKAIRNNGDCVENLNDVQVSWLQSVLSSAKTTGLHVVVAQHFPFISKGRYGVTNNANVIESDFSIPNGEYIYNNGGIDDQVSRIALPYLSGIIEDYKSNGGTFVCWLCGHTHYDLLEEVVDSGQKVIVISTAKYNASSQRTIRNTQDESMDLFNIFSVDTINRVVKVFRVGSHLTPAMQKIDTMYFIY